MNKQCGQIKPSLFIFFMLCGNVEIENDMQRCMDEI